MRVLLFLDIGGSMDDHVRASEELFSAARSEFKHLAFFYFHNCPYERVWTDNRRRPRRSDPDRGGDADLRPRLPRHLRGRRDHEPVRDRHARRQRGALERGSRQRLDQPHDRPLAAQRLAEPVAAADWGYTQSIGMVRALMENRMFPLTPAGLDEMTRALVH